MTNLVPPFILGIGIGLIVMIPFIAIAWRRRWKRYLMAEREVSGAGFFPVRYCSDLRYQKWLKFFPWEGIGFVGIRDNSVCLHAFPNKGEPFQIITSRDSVKDHGAPNRIRNGLLPWIKLEAEEGIFYFAAETGPFIFGAKFQNSTLLRLLTDGLESG